MKEELIVEEEYTIENKKQFNALKAGIGMHAILQEPIKYPAYLRVEVYSTNRVHLVISQEFKNEEIPMEGYVGYIDQI